jgi:hypothetical protein
VKGNEKAAPSRTGISAAQLRALRRAQAIVAQLTKGRDLVQELIDERRAEVAREEAETAQYIESKVRAAKRTP